MIKTAAINLTGDGEIRDRTGRAKDITAERVSEGVYRIHGANGMPADGWRTSIPRDDNDQLLFLVEITERPGHIEVATTNDGQPHDIDPGRVLTLRFAVEVPDDDEPEEGDGEQDADH